MNGVVFMETVRRGWRTALYWGIGIALYAMYIILVFGGDDSTRAQMADLVANKMPGFLGQIMGLPDDVAFLATMQGFLGFGYFTYVSLMMSVWAVLAGLSVTANDEDTGVINMLMALPIPRWRLVVERIAGNVVLLIGIIGCGLAGLWFALQLSPDPTVMFGALTATMAGEVLLLSVVMAVTALLAVLVKRRSLAAGLAGVFVMVSFLLNTLGGAVQSSVGDALRNFSVFYHFEPNNILQNGLALGSVTVLMAALVAVTWGAVYLFQKRDLGG